ncbi:MAG: hypothetical protein CMF82_00305 [Candidatus Marinimicrobia bacterium]|nr:hypothetical protein [Candidatus Neomarinimicrobiota bacterium]|tara:strand:+ start:1522 stop:2601 length:1080 start_codon:yes stop_codon:yes gene_type:complete
MIITQRGGDVVGSGAYGCVFNPPIKCKNKTRKKKGISKVMLKNDALNETLNIGLIKEIVKKLPNYKRFFILYDELCIPDQFSKNNVKELNNNCDESIKYAYKKNEVLLANYQPYGGKDLHTHIGEHKNSSVALKEKFIKTITKKVITLLKDGLIPLHKKNIYHLDLKPSNLVWNNKHIKVIDWGFAIINDETHIHESHDQFFFSYPYENILFNIPNGTPAHILDKHIKKTINESKNTIFEYPIAFDILIFEYEDFYSELEKTSEKHMNKTVKNWLYSYINSIARECLVNGKFDRDYFLTHFYRKHDYWGLLYLYVEVLRIYLDLTPEFKKKIRNLLLCLVSGLNINVKDVQKKLNDIIL